MLTTELRAARPGFDIRVVTCRDDHAGWSPPEVRSDFGVVLARRGRFGWRSRGQRVDVDPTVGYVSVPGSAEQFAHPAGGDVCTAVSFGPELWRSGAPARPAIYVDARLDLAHRRLLRAVRGQDVDFGVAEEMLRLLTVASRSPVLPVARDRVLVADAREAILNFDSVAEGLLPLAASLGVSPYRLSRAFTRSLGVSLTRYRNRVRVGRALDRLEAGERNLAVLAADLGFADQAHLTRTVREHVGETPRALLQESSRPPTAGGRS
ncbi:helix-turn-helix domain-containing protein [Actinocrispum wychmicini]|uniref:AraC-like DNA-binding protein n=1 Tax=Actinocrispum wychmicini TaxID=1213861 RepID=A0A4R2JHG9_9PSEU|nr:helix-turn-helix transcriptional regulator [Actinocrispum wychmicini]TCO53575.1 AraC-like DNA-binding protein [Actinocrispum wychmicini]